MRKTSHQKPDEITGTKISDAKDAAIAYIKQLKSEFNVDQQLQEIDSHAEIDLSKDELELHYKLGKEEQGLSIQTFEQTFYGIPLWESAIGVRLNAANLKVHGSISYIQYTKPQLDPPGKNDLSKYAEIDETKLRELLNFGDLSNFELQSSDRLYIYKYFQNKRLDHPLDDNGQPINYIRSLPPASVRNGTDHLVREVLFLLKPNNQGMLNWRCLIAVKTGEILYLRVFTSSVSGLVYEKDPYTQGGTPSTTDNNAILNPFRTSVVLPRLQDPVNGIQELRGDDISGYARVVDPVDDANHPRYGQLLNIPNADPPTEPTNDDFDYDVRTDDFAAVNAYYNVDRFLALVVDVGILVKQDPNSPDLPFYFTDTEFPLGADHSADFFSSNVNASAPGGPGGQYALGIRFGDINSQSSLPGMATSFRVTLHEFGHVLLYDHVNGPNFGFAHSFGDSLAAIINDPDSEAPDRFNTFPWVNSGFPQLDRRHDREVSNGWAWDGSQDVGGYLSEQILSTTLFHAYRSFGGDDDTFSRRIFASRLMFLLLLKSVIRIGEPLMNPNHAEDFADFMIEADTDATDLPNIIDGVPLGAFHKVIRWAFEKQGAYQEDGNEGNSEGLPPAVDLYIDDGRNGEYAFQENFWNSLDIVNRTQNDGGQSHQIPILNSTNYLYVRVQNRGDLPADNIVLKGYHCLPSGGLVWPQDWQAMQTPQINFPGAIAPGATEYIGPFEWVPTNQGHECLLITAQADGDEPNTETVSNIPHWALVPHDNNIAQRNVAPAPGFTGGGGGTTEFTDAFQIFQFTVKNPFKKDITVRLEIKLPQILKSRGWQLDFPNTGSRFLVKNFDRQGILVKMSMTSGQPFTRQDVINARDRDITVNMVCDEGIIGGMTYSIDPDLKVYKEQ